jgi:hypothetical protein
MQKTFSLNESIKLIFYFFLFQFSDKYLSIKQKKNKNKIFKNKLFSHLKKQLTFKNRKSFLIK